MEVTDGQLKLPDTNITTLGYILTSLGYILTSPSLKVYINIGLFGLKAYWKHEVLDHLKTKETCIEAVEKIHASWCVPDHLKTQEMYNKAVRIEPILLWYVPDHLKTQDMCNKAACKHTWLLQYVPHWFVAQQQLKIWHNDDEDKFLGWYKGYKNIKNRRHK